MSQARRRVPAWALLPTLLCLTALCSCRSTRAVRAPDPVTAGAERAVWEALIREAYTSDKTKVVVLDPALSWTGDDWSFGPKPQGVPGDAWQALVIGIRQSGSLPKDLHVGVPVAWFGDQEFAELPSGNALIEGRWPAFHERFPGNSGHISISRIGFSRDGRTAVVYGWVGSGSLSGSGDLFVLRKTDQGWSLVGTHNRVIA